MSTREDLTGRKFGKLTVIKFDHSNRHNISMWLCQCECGNTKVVSSSNLKSGNTSTCGDAKCRIEDLTGTRYGRLEVIGFDHIGAYGNAFWLCQCECGNTLIVCGSHLKSGHTTSCGPACKQREAERDLTGHRFGRLKVIGKDIEREKHEHWICQCECGNLVSIYRGHLLSGASTSCGCYHREQCRSHGHCGERLYNIWQSMKYRCNPTTSTRYPNYSGRGVKLCEEWNEFINFYNWAINNGYDYNLSIDRIDNDGDYCPENCRWADNFVQQNNKSTNRFVTYNGVKHTLAEWSRILSVKPNTLRRHVNLGNMRDFEKYFNERQRHTENE